MTLEWNNERTTELFGYVYRIVVIQRYTQRYELHDIGIPLFLPMRLIDMPMLLESMHIDIATHESYLLYQVRIP